MRCAFCFVRFAVTRREGAGGVLNDNVKVYYLLADGRGIHPRRLVLALLQRELVLRRFPVDGVVEVHAGHVAVQVVPVQQESALREDDDDSGCENNGDGTCHTSLPQTRYSFFHGPRRNNRRLKHSWCFTSDRRLFFSRFIVKKNVPEDANDFGERSEHPPPLHTHTHTEKSELTRAASVMSSEPENMIMAATSPPSSCSLSRSFTFISVIVLFMSANTNNTYAVLNTSVPLHHVCTRR